ncbi:MAG TPA: acid phosphatase [Kofleriaceae bacterium]|nr:acid phosphatase [Kofleriaceae bacterium]
MTCHAMKRCLSIALFSLAACGGSSHKSSPDSSNPDGSNPASLDSIQTIVVIYAENRGFDNLYGSFPGANGLPVNGTYIPQIDRDGTQLAKLPQTWTGVTSAGFTPVITQAQSDNLPNAPYSLQATYAGLDFTYITRDLYHRFFENQMQIDGGSNDAFAAYADSGGLVMGHYDGSQLAMWALASQFVLADNFFMGAFGGSFLNHQYLICACAPEYPDADTDPAKPTIAVLDTDTTGAFVPSLAIADTSPASAIDGIPVFTLSGNIVPKNYFGDATFRAVNTMQPPYQPSGNAPATTDTSMLYADRSKATTLPPQTEMTVGDQLDAKGITWAWYSGAWDSTLQIATTTRDFPPSTQPGSAPNFQFHHQPFNYYAAFDPQSGAAERTAHLKDYTDLMSDITAGTLPSVVFYKPEGDLNQHSGYASVAAGDQHIAQLVQALQHSPQYANMVIVITYDENGGWWDHVAPPLGDLLGPGTRIPAIIVSPYAKRGFVDHTPYDTGSILRLIDKRFGLPPLPGTTARDQALAQNGEMPMGDLTNALQFP